jgi:hypothetical protein
MDMPAFTVRCSDEQHAAWKHAADAAGVGLEHWVKQIADNAAARPITRQRYAYRAAGPGKATVKRLSDLPDGVTIIGEGWSRETADTMQKIKLLIIRNEPGDRETAVGLLKSVFETVVEIGI